VSERIPNGTTLSHIYCLFPALSFQLIIHQESASAWHEELAGKIKSQIHCLRGQSTEWYKSSRNQELTENEEREQFGYINPSTCAASAQQRRLTFENSGNSKFGIESDVVEECEKALVEEFLQQAHPQNVLQGDMPNCVRLENFAKSSRIGRKLLDDQIESWKKYEQEHVQEIRTIFDGDCGAKSFVLKLRENENCILQQQSGCFEYIVKCLCTRPNMERLAKEASITDAERRNAKVTELFSDLYITNENRFTRSSNTKESRTACLRDITRLFLDKKIIGQVNPFIAKECINEIHRVMGVYLEAEVLREKFSRLLKTYCGCADDTDLETEEEIQHVAASIRKSKGLLVQEIQCHRKWSTAKHPGWLVFEVEQRLQIRPQQYDVAMACISHPGSISQLNMGEGKTRVIIPMLVIHFSSAARVDSANFHPPIMRITILPALMAEFSSYLTQVMQHSVFQKRIYLSPFNRDVDVCDPRKAKRLRDAFLECAHSGGVLLETPESRLSKMLKYYELYLSESDTSSGSKEAVMLLKEVVNMPAVDILDEADEELKQNKQLIYAVKADWAKSTGTVPLPDGEMRWQTLQAIFRVLNSDCTTVKRFLGDYKDIVCLGERSVGGRFRPLRFIAGQKTWNKKETKKLLASIVYDELKLNPPFELKCLDSLAADQLDFARNFVLNPEDESDGKSHPKFMGWVDSSQMRTVLLCLRGFLGCGVAFSALEKRHRVEYGTNLKAGKKQLAIPYRASDTPADRAEYGHPDMAIALTHLSYYLDGLTDNQLRQCILLLLRKGPLAQEDFYNKWFELYCDDDNQGVSKEDKVKRKTIDTPGKLDLENEEQFQFLCQCYRYNFEVINFFLHAGVLPVETRQYPKKIVANAYDLAQSHGHTVGFSGTKDNSMVLPPEVYQHTLPHLMGTDGKMLACVQRNSVYHDLKTRKAGWRELLDSALSCGKYAAFVDAGGLLAGSSNKAVAEHILSSHILGRVSNHRGVVYFEPGGQGGQEENQAASQTSAWMVVNVKGVHEQLDKSPLAESECFALYDQSRTRGADLKLRYDAKALVTVGPRMCKDQLMQAVGRLRKIHFDQTVEFVGPQEVSNSIREECSAYSEGNTRQALTSEDLLFWVTLNSIRAVEDALLPWTNQGATYCAVGGDPRSALLDEQCDLATFYGNSTAEQLLRDVGKNDFEAQMRRPERCKQNESNDSRDAIRIGCSPPVPPPQVPGKSASTPMLNRYERTQNKIFEQLDIYGCDRKVTRNLLDDEYERELEQEAEEEHERELPPHEDPASSSEWSYADLVKGKDAVSFHTRPAMDVLAEVKDAYAIFGQTHPKHDQLCLNTMVTNDFRITLKRQKRAMLTTGMQLYLRPVNGYLLQFQPPASVTKVWDSIERKILITDKEAGCILDAIYDHGRSFHAGKKSSKSQKNRFVVVTHIPNSSSHSVCHREGTVNGLAMMAVNCAGESVDLDQVLCANAKQMLPSLQLFNGESKLPTAEAKIVARRMLRLDGGTGKMMNGRTGKIMKAIRVMRGRESEFDRSDLNEILLSCGVESGY
jgi:hypothetical protein